MYINGTVNYNAKYKALEIYIYGCVNDCDGCCSPQFKNFKHGKKLNREIIDKAIMKYRSGIDRIWITGGEPADMPHWDLESLMKHIIRKFNAKKLSNLECWLWTSRSLTTLRPNLKRFFTHVKTGKYDKTKPPIYIPEYDITLASNNQRIIELE